MLPASDTQWRRGATQASRRFALPTLVAILAAVLLATRGPAAVEDEAADDMLTATSERMIAYVLTPEHGPRFRLPGGPELLRVSAHLVLPSGQTYVASRRYAFGIEATLRAPDGEVLWRRHLSDRTDQTKAGYSEGGWIYEAAFAADHRYELSDSAGLELALPSCPPGSTIELRLSEETGILGPDGNKIVVPFNNPSALVRVHRRVDLGLAGESLRRSATQAALGKARLAASTFLPWHALREAHRAHAEAEAWERMPAEGRAGVDYRGESVYVAAGPPPAPPPPEAPALAIAPGQSALVHLLGPGVATVRTRGTATVSTDMPQEIAVRTRWLGPFPAGPEPPPAAPPVSLLSIPITDAWQEQAIPLTAGWTTLELSTAVGAADVQVVATDGARHPTADEAGFETARESTFAALRLPAETERSGCAGARLTHRAACTLTTPPPPPSALIPVDLRTLPLYRIGPDIAPLAFNLTGPKDIYTRTLRFDVRSFGAVTPVRLGLEFLDARGQVIAGEELMAEPLNLSQFERVRQPSSFFAESAGGGDEEDGQPPSLLPALGLALAERPVSEPVALRLIAPPEAVRLQIAGDASALLDVRTVLPPPADEVGGSPWVWPYDQVVIDDERWRYAPRRRDRWFPLRAEDHALRRAAGQVMPLQAQIRREYEPPRPTTEGPWVTTKPRGGAQRLDILELVPPSRRAEVIASWGPGDVSVLRPNTLERIDLRHGYARPTRMRYHAIGGGVRALGQNIDMQINDTDSDWLITARAETRRLKRPKGGLLSLIWSSGPESVRIIVNRPTLSGAPIYTARQIYRLADGPLTVDVPKRAGAVEALHVVVYWLEGAPTTATSLKIAIDGGAPKRHSARGVNISQAEHSVVLIPDSSAELLRTDRDTPVRAQRTTFTIRLGDDLAPGRHSVTFHRESGSPVWLRLFREAPKSRSAGRDLELSHDD
ncbi:hypothetical protein [Nannocystis pusilla]|uniref:VIT domain-containing protein n=1 Tax=Nannocystis pusilla TaxID=889268 RepID=A0ABS7TW23_9BACT|nr:hypothetical protein [Nannocystis pusilla]MBZ5712231.1 hypothetical protein [Nannocystis pusilla]